MNKTLSMVTIVPLKSTIESLMVAESESFAVNSICKKFMEKINEGVSETILCESFVVELSKVADSAKTKNAISVITEAMKNNESNIKLANSVEGLKNGPCLFVAPMIESAVVDYITNKNSETRDAVRLAVSLFENESNVVSILETLNYETYQEKSGVKLNNVVVEKQDEPKERVYTQSEVEAIIESKKAEVAPQENVKKSYRDIHTGIDLNGVISKIVSECKNEKLKVFCGQYINALNEGKSEESLCEAFISGASNWTYLNAVDTELSALSDRVNKYKQEISFKRIMETMLQTSSYYIVPLIEDCIVEYVENKNLQTRGMMLQRLYSFEYDPFVRDIITLVTRDASIDNTVKLGESLVETCTKTEYIYSPIQYIKENECVFNVKGSYFVKKGNSISKLSKKAVAELSESFKSLCNIVNSGNVTFSTIDESVTVYDGYNMAVISESEIIVNNKKVTVTELDNLYESSVMMNSDDKNFYGLTKVMNENFNDIAYIDFVKRVSSNDGSGKAVDVFKVKNNIFVNTVNENLGVSTFYRNVNPIQCRNYINEHMEINVTSLFEDVLPEQEKIEKNIEDGKKEYEDYIKSLEDQKETIMSMKDEADSDDIDKAIELIDKEIDDAKAEYEKYQKDSDKFLNGDDDDKEDSLADEVPDMDGDDEPEDSDDMGDREPNETPAEMEIPIEQTTPIVSDDEISSDSSFDNVADFDSDFDAPAVNDNGDTSFDVVKVSYNRNIKTGEYTGKGEVLVVIPSVDANGDIHNETRKVAFYLDTTSGDKKVVINNDYMPLDMYLAIQNAIEECPETDTITVGSSAPEMETEPDFNTDDMSDESTDIDNEIEGIDFADDEMSDESEELVDDSDEDSIEEPAKAETPAETQEKSKDAKYPITLGVYPDEIAPIEMSDFQNALDSMGIKHSTSEANDGEVIFEMKSRSDVHNLKKYFKVWKNYNDKQFGEFFPELDSCSRRVNEGVEISNVKAITESSKHLSVVLPATSTYYKMFGITPTDNVVNLTLIAESNDEAYKIYEKLYEHARRNDYNVEQDVIDLLIAHEEDFLERANESVVYELNVPYNGFLSQKLAHKGFRVNESSKNMSVEILKGDFNKAKKVLESFYTNEIPSSVSDFFQFARSLNEAVTITIRDDKSGKTVEINTDDALNNDGGVGDNNEQANFSSSFDNVTFKPEDSLAFSDDDESADDEDEKDTDKKEDSKDEKLNDSEEQNPEDASEESTEDGDDTDEGESDNTGEETEESEESTEEKPKKKFKFKAKKKNESVEYNASIKLNENVNASVLDFVKIKSMDKKGQVISQLNDDNIVVHVDGHTVLCSPKDVQVLNPKYDTLPPHMKFDPVTLKGIFESYVDCGLFINNVRITPSDCQVKLMEYFSTPDDKEVEIVIEGTKTPALKKFIRIVENVNDVIDIANYVPGKVNTLSGKVDALVNLNDYTQYKNVNESYSSVRVLLFNANKETMMVMESGVNVSLDVNDDIYIPEYVESVNNAIETLLS